MPAAAVPARRPLEESVTPEGSVLAVVKVGAGKPVAVNGNEPALPGVNVVVVTVPSSVGARLTVRATAVLVETARLG